MATKQGRLANLSRKQFGVVQRAQLLELGFSSSGICRASRKGELARFLPGVWRVTSAPRCWEQRPLGAVLWAGEPSVASHITSAHLQEVLPRSARAIEITSPRSSAGRHGIITHRCNLQNVEMVNVRGIPCTSIYRTLVDLCASQPQCISEQALDAALRMGRVSYERLCDYAKDAASRSVKGSRTLKGLLHAHEEVTKRSLRAKRKACSVDLCVRGAFRKAFDKRPGPVFAVGGLTSSTRTKTSSLRSIVVSFTRVESSRGATSVMTTNSISMASEC
jgi:predicted transcriptional regulator of viral defense system